MADISREELEKLIEKAERDKQAMLEKMTPEEREAAEQRAKKLIEEDNAEMQRLIAAAAAAAGAPAPEKTKGPRLCPSCGAPAGEEKYCSFCGNLLKP